MKMITFWRHKNNPIYTRGLLLAKIGPGNLKEQGPFRRFLIQNVHVVVKFLGCKGAHLQACFEGTTGDFPGVPVGQHTPDIDFIIFLEFIKLCFIKKCSKRLNKKREATAVSVNSENSKI